MVSKEHRDCLKHEHSEELLGSIVYQLMSDPNRTSALFASINSNAIEVDDALYLQEESEIEVERINNYSFSDDTADDDLDNFDWQAVKRTKNPSIEEVEDLDPLGDFLAQMNK